MQLRFGAGTDPGRVRERNEDRYVADADLCFFAVVDGMGGHAGGELASATIAEAATAFIRETASSDATVAEVVDLPPEIQHLKLADVAIVFGKRPGKRVRAVIAADKVQVVDVFGRQHRSQRRRSRRGDWAWGQSGVPIGVIR